TLNEKASHGSTAPSLSPVTCVGVTVPKARFATGVAPIAWSAWKAITIPAPESLSTPAASMSSAEEVSAVLTCAGVSDGFEDRSNPAMAAACGAAADVPKNGLKPGAAHDTPSAAAKSGFWRINPPVADT